MSKIPVFSLEGGAAGTVELADALLVQGKGEQAVHDTVVAYLAGLRAGTASTKTRGVVAGSGRKPWKQKGTGRARVGSIRSPIWRGGGIIFGPHPRSYEQKVNKKVSRLAFRRALSERVVAGDVKVVESLTLAEPKTRSLAAILKKLGVTRGALVVVEKLERNLTLAVRNLPDVELVTAEGVNTYQMLRHPVVLVSRPAMSGLEQRLKA